MKESEIQKQILDYCTILEAQGRCFFFRSGAGAIQTKSGGYFKTGRAGVPDISIILKGGRYLGCEIKTREKSSKQSDKQKEVMNQIDKLDGIYMLVRSLQEFKKLFEKVE